MKKKFGRKVWFLIFKMKNTINPLLMLGTYLGVLAGLVFSLRGWHPFWWLPPLLGVEINDLRVLDCVGGGLAGYVLHIIFRIFEWNGGKEKMINDK